MEYVQEVQILIQRSILINGNYKPFRVISYICDTPARALVKQIKGHRYRLLFL